MSHAVVIGAGPAGLMAAEVMAAAGLKVTLCEAKPSVGRKFLMAGKSGLNLTKDEALGPFTEAFAEAAGPLASIIRAFDSDAVKAWAQGLEQEVFTGSTGNAITLAPHCISSRRQRDFKLNGFVATKEQIKVG